MSSFHGQKRKTTEEPMEGSSGEPVPKQNYVSMEFPSLPNNIGPPVPVNVLNLPFRMDLLVMCTIPRYWNGALKLGSGAFGNVYLVHSDRLDEKGQTMFHNEFVLKVVRAQRQNRFEDIVREVNMHRQCRDHDNVLFAGVCYCQISEEGYKVQMCLEYCALSDLSLMVVKEKTENHIAYVCREVIKGLIYIHNLRIVHGDISYKNVLATHRGVIKLSDFGMADTFDNTNVQGREVQRGTPGFMAPEIMKRNGYDGKADLWSLGVLLLSLVMQKNPFKQGALFDIHTYQRQINEGFYPDIDQIKMSDELRELLDDLSQYDPTERSEAHELTLDLFLTESCSRREFLEYYSNLRIRHRMDLPFPDETQGFTVPTTRE